MDYTTVARVKEAIRIKESADDAYLAKLVTAASRYTDKWCAKSQRAVNYFELAWVADEECRAQVDQRGMVLAWPRKNTVVSASSMQYRTSPISEWTDVPAERIVVEPSGYAVEGWVYLRERPRTLFVRVTYQGGVAATVADVPPDLMEAVTLLAARMYREDESGLTDAMGIAELGTLQYTKALPERYIANVEKYLRPVPY